MRHVGAEQPSQHQRSNVIYHCVVKDSQNRETSLYIEVADGEDADAQAVKIADGMDHKGERTPPFTAIQSHPL